MNRRLLLWALEVFLLCTNSSIVSANPALGLEHRSTSPRPSNGRSNRRMVAARSALGLEARQVGSRPFLRTEHVLPFLEEHDPSSKGPASEPFAAHVQLKSMLPTLLIEEHEDVLESVTCTASTIDLTFIDIVAASIAYAELFKHRKLLVITSHYGCNAEGERRPFTVSKVSQVDRSIVLSTGPTSFKKSFHSIDVQLGRQHTDAALKRHDHALKKRQGVPPTSAASPEPSIKFPPAPSSSPTETRIVGAAVSTAWVGTTILPPSFPGADLIVPDLPLGLDVQCKNCSIRGSIDLVGGTINMQPQENEEDETFLDAFTGSIDEIIDFYTNGYIELTVNDFSAHIELESTVKPSATLATYTAPFPDIGIPGWVIPQIAEVGPVLRPQVAFGVQLASELQFTYGFDLKIPNNSTIQIDINSPATKSNVTGFQQTNFTALPFQSQIDNINLTVFAAFNPQLLLTINILEDNAEISTGVLLDMPKLSATIAQVNNVDEHCNPANATATDDDKHSHLLDNSLTNIVPKVDFNVGVLVDGEADIMQLSTEIGATATLTGTGYTLPTACMSYDGKAKTYGAAKAVSTGKGKGTTAAGAGRLENPIAAFCTPWGGVVAAAMAMLLWGSLNLVI